MTVLKDRNRGAGFENLFGAAPRVFTYFIIALSNNGNNNNNDNYNKNDNNKGPF